jgi:phosphoglycerate dehydrogenase-like enzyme
MKPHIILFSAKGRDSLLPRQQQQIEAIATVTYIANLSPLPDDKLIHLCQSAHYIGLTRRTCQDFHTGIISNLPNLKGLSIYATGTEWIDLAALAQSNIALKLLPDYSRTTVAEHAIALLLTLSRRIHLSDRMAAHEISPSISLRGWELSGKQLGMVGLGRIGSRIATLAQAFEMEVSYCDPKVMHPEFRSMSMAQLLHQSDVLILAASVDRSCPIILTAEVLSAVKRGIYIINPARPALVDNCAILRAIQSGIVAGYAVDDYVFSVDEMNGVERGRIVQTGHTAWYSNEAMERGTERWINNLVELVTHG